ncbi:MAG: ribonuclease HI [Anaerolineales bacterium]|nr:ribonuclease HI [Chloroflexota bacterium]MBL6982534.1 ribonuclease HI [Anaerolineales bacterium]
MTKLPHVTIYTDGACSGNPGPGGWAALLKFGIHEKELFGSERETTNNRMELTAALESFKALKEACQIDFYTDSEYLRRGINEWMATWKRKGWKTAAKKPVKNQDLWKALDDAVHEHQISWHWVRGHAGNQYNERVDKLARKAIPD